jgi:P-type Ca2+ transporter type 2C
MLMTLQGLIPLLFGLPLVFWPLHIAFLEMIIDPACSILFEAEGEEADTMRQPPHDHRSGGYLQKRSVSGL